MNYFKKSFNKATKYGEIKSERPGGLVFASKLEGAVYDHLWLREKAGEIKIIQCQKHVKLTRAEIVCIPDFYVLDILSGEPFFVEAKGCESERWLIVRKLWRKYGPGKLEIFKGTYKKIYLAETIIPDLEDNQLCLEKKIR